MAGHEQGHQLVAQLHRRHRRPVLVAGGEQHREDVVAILACAFAPAFVDRLVDERVGLVARLRELAPAAAALEHRQHRGRPRAVLEDPGQPVAEGVEPRARVEPEHRPQDHLERERLEARMERHRLVLGPAVHLAPGHLLDEPRQPLHLLSVECGQHQLSLAEVGSLVEQDHRVRANDRLEDARALSGVKHLGRRGEDLAQMLRLRVVHERRRLEQAHGEPLAVTLAAPLEERHRAVPPRDRLKRARHPRPWRETHVRNVTASLRRSVRCSTHERDS